MRGDVSTGVLGDDDTRGDDDTCGDDERTGALVVLGDAVGGDDGGDDDDDDDVRFHQC